MSYPATPVFNTLLHSEILLADMAYCAILPVLILDKYHHGSLSAATYFPENFDGAFAELQKIARVDRMFHKISRWEQLVNGFINTITPILVGGDGGVGVAPTLTLQQQVKIKSEHSEYLEHSREIVNHCISLLYHVRGLRLECKQDLCQYIDTVNSFITGNKASMATIFLQVNEANKPTAQAHRQAPQTPMTQYLLKAQARISSDAVEQKVLAQVAKGQSLQFRGHAEFYADDGLEATKRQAMLTQQASDLYAESHETLAQMLAIQEGTLVWLQQYLTESPLIEDVTFKIGENCNLMLETIEETVQVTSQNKFDDAGKLKKCVVKQTVLPAYKAPFLCENANVHMLTEDLIIKFSAESAKFSLVDGSIMTKISERIAAYSDTGLTGQYTTKVFSCARRLQDKIDLHMEYKKKARPASYASSPSIMQFKNNRARFEAALEFAGSGRVRGWLSAIATFEQIKNNLADMVFHHIASMTHMLRTQLGAPEKEKNIWLETLLTGLVDFPEALPLQNIPMNRAHLAGALKGLISYLEGMKTHAQKVKAFNLPVRRVTKKQHQIIYTQLAAIVNAFKTMHTKSTLVDIPYPKSVGEDDMEQVNDIFSTAVKSFIEGFATDGHLQKYLKELLQANKTIPMYVIGNLNSACEQFIDIDGHFSNNILTSITQVSGIYRGYLKDFQSAA